MAKSRLGRAIPFSILVVCLAPALVAQEAGIRVEEVASTKGNPAAYFGTIGDMVEVSPGLVMVADDVSERVHLWDVSAGSVRRFARAGDGPGEVRTPVQLARRPGGGFGLYDVGHAAVLLFDSTLAFDRKVPLGPIISNAKDFSIMPDGSFLLAGGRIADPKHLQRYSSAGSRLAEWGEPSPLLEDVHARVQVAGGALRATGDGELLFAVAAPYRVVRFSSLDLADPALVTEDLELVPVPSDEELVRPGSFPGSTAFRWWFDRTTAVLELGDGRLLTVVTRFYEGDSVWSLHGADGRLLARSVVDRAYDVYDLMRDGRVVGSYRDPETDERTAVVVSVEAVGVRGHEPAQLSSAGPGTAGTWGRWSAGR